MNLQKTYDAMKEAGSIEPIQIDFSAVDTTKLGIVLKTAAFQKMTEFPANVVTSSQDEELKDTLHSSIYQFMKGRDINNKEFNNTFAEIAYNIDIRLIRELFGIHLAMRLKGKTPEEINQSLGLEDDLADQEKNGLKSLLEEIEF